MFAIKSAKKLLFAFLILGGGIGLATTLTDEFEIAKNLELYANVYRELNTYYVDDIPPEDLMKSGLDAMLKSLDPYTTYIPADEVERFRSSITGSYAGIGTRVRAVSAGGLVTAIYPNGPAHKAGLMAGDTILYVDEVALNGKQLSEISQELRGKMGQAMQLTVHRPGQAKNLTFSLRRQNILINNLPHYEVLPGKIAYFSLTTFSEKAGQHLGEALEALQEKEKLNGVILDLRGNTGGLLSEAVNVINVFVPRGREVVSIQGREKSQQQIFRTLNMPIDSSIALAVLINERSASASEIVAGAIQDLDRGIIIGQRSFGKGLVQNTVDLPHGAKLKLTTARYYIPSGRCIQSLEYENGEPKVIADSLRQAFQTLAGRKVYDGGGVRPDLPYENKEWLSLKKQLLASPAIFDFGVQYRSKNKLPEDLEKWSLKAQDFDDFMALMDKNAYLKKSKTALALEKFEKELAKEGEMEKALSQELASLEKGLSNLERNKILAAKDKILHLLEVEIVEQEKLIAAGIAHSLKADSCLDMALELLGKEKKYQALLTP